MSRQGHNAFYYFMLDFKEKQGRNFRSLKEVADAAGPHWKNLSKTQKAVFEQRAKAMKSTKLNSDQKPVDEVEQMERQEMQLKDQMKDEIQGIMSFAKRSKTLGSHLFYIIHFNSFCQHDKTKMYSPCEVAISSFSLKDGVFNNRVFHAMIKPGPLPLGYASIAQQHSSETHQIELPWAGDDAEDNQEEVFMNIIEFLSLNRRISDIERFPILYAADKNLQMATSIITMWCEMFDLDERLFSIYNLQDMFRILRNMVANRECWASDTMSYQEIEKDVYNYTPGIACDYHEMADALVFCSRSIVVRYAYIICDNCCRDAKVELIPGCHVPLNSMMNESPFTKVKSKSSKKSSKLSSESSVREDSSDADTVISIGKSEWNDSISSASTNFPNLTRSKITGHASQSTTTYETDDDSTVQEDGNHMGSYAGATSLKTGSSGFSKRPPALPFSITEEFKAMTVSQESMDNHFPAIGGSGRGQKFTPLVRGKGRGHPFKKPST